MFKSDELSRLDFKSLDGQLLWELENGFELSPRESQLILETIHLYYDQNPEARAGRVSLWVVKRDAMVGKPIESLPRIQVWVSLDGGREDLEVYRSYGHVGLRRQKLLRLSEEIVDQGGVGTQADLARLLGTSLRTIRRDIAFFRKHGIRVLTRGSYSDIGPGISHRVNIVEMYLSGYVYTEICRRTRHSAGAVKRYVNTFMRVVALYERGISSCAELTHYVGLSERLAGQYLELYFKVRENPQWVRRLEDLVEQSASRPGYEGEAKKKGSSLLREAVEKEEVGG
ncbi:MAG: DUF1670 domain-containing protein [Aliifodinibius sp.]|nr:DUF1670 domain-containing protein [Fodinibius sp.]NIX01248.1 DUF1670 domain-containing protein [Phycisphaerae bacterium]NIY26527.1 DUF1670 domain-containing protein [Fodinibius sp.]